MKAVPSAHLTWRELECVNRLEVRGVGVPFQGIPPGGLVAPYPLDLRPTRGAALGRIHEAIRSACSRIIGVDTPITVGSGYRTREYDAAVGGVSGWHVLAGAMDLWTPRAITLETFHAAILRLADSGAVPDLGAVGLYTWGCHVDLRPRVRGALVQWDYR